MAENRKGTLYEHFRAAWPVLLAVGCGLFWLGRNVLTPAEIDHRVETLIRPLQDKSEWLEAEMRRHEKRERGTTAHIEQRLKALERRVESR